MKQKCQLPSRFGIFTYLNFEDPEDMDHEWIRLLKALR